MMESLRYGVPAGIFLFALLVLQVWLGMEGATPLRWLVGLTAVILFALISYRNRNPAHFPYSFAWFSGFNVLSAAVLVHALIIMLVHPWLGDVIGLVGWQAILQGVAFIEFIYQAGMGLLILTLLALVFYKKKKNE